MKNHMDTENKPDKKHQYEEAFQIFDRDANSMVDATEIIKCI